MSDKREQIVTAALELFCSHGFQNTSTALISKEAGVATGTLFLYFKSKDELINTLYSEAKADMAAHVQVALNPAAQPLQQLQHGWQKAIEWALEHPFKYRFTTMFSSSPFITRLTKEEAASAFGFMNQLVESALATGSIKPIEPELFITLFGGQLQATISYLFQHPEASGADAIRHSFDLFINGVAS